MIYRDEKNCYCQWKGSDRENGHVSQIRQFEYQLIERNQWYSDRGNEKNLYDKVLFFLWYISYGSRILMRLPYGLLWFSLLFLVFPYICTSKLSYKIEKLNGKMVNELLFEQLFRCYHLAYTFQHHLVNHKHLSSTVLLQNNRRYRCLWFTRWCWNVYARW